MVFSSCCHLHVVIHRPKPLTKQGLASVRYLVGRVGVASYMAKYILYKYCTMTELTLHFII